MIGGSTGGVIIIKGRVLVGMTNCGRKGDDNHCYISAYDAKTGKRDWKFVTVALKGQKGGDTWGDLPDNERKGGETWIAGTYDPESNTTYWGTAQAKPWRRDLRGSGDGATEYANSTIALDADTGKLKWAYNHAPGESLDLDEVFERGRGAAWRPEIASDHRQAGHPLEARRQHRQVHRRQADGVPERL